MSIPKPLFVQATYILLVMVTITDGALFAYVVFAKKSLKIPASFSRDFSSGSEGIPPSGYLASGKSVPLPEEAGKGWVVRYASPRCEYCRADEARWYSLKSGLIKEGYRIYGIPPTSPEGYSDNAPELVGETQISYVNVAWMKRYRFSATPTTILFDSHGKAIWTKMGEMTKDDESDALRVGVVKSVR